MAIEGEEWREAEVPAGEDPDRLSDRPDAEVLEQAREGIETHRKGDVELVLLAPDGKPAPRRRVRIEQTRSAFLWGSPIYEVCDAAREGRMQSLRMQNYAHYYTGLLNAATALCYWNERTDPWVEKYQGDTKFREFIMQADWSNAHGLVVKGHPVVWTVPKAIPDWLRRYDTETQMKFLEVRVRNFVGGLREKVRMWDVVNEMLWEPSMRNLAKRKWPHIEPIPEILTYVAPAIRWARQENPDATLLINDYGLIYSNTSEHNPDVTARMQRRRYLELAEALERDGAAPDALGIQAHTGGRWYRMADAWAVFDELARSGLALHITEFGAGVHGAGPEAESLPMEEKLARQAAYAARFYTTAFGHPAVRAVFYWGLPHAAFPFAAGGGQRIPNHIVPTPMYEALRRLIREEWMTRTEAVSDDRGRVRFRGFFGDYVLHCSPERASLPFTVTGPGPASLALRLSK